jgi:phosphohistidine phosphatase
MEIQILLVRHGEAVDQAPGLGDEGRFLTPKGRKISRRMARWLAKRDERSPAAIWTSPLVRAVQTAEILAERARPCEGVVAKGELSPNADPREVLELLAAYEGPGPLALVGHEPLLSLVGRALLGDVDWEGLKKSGVLAVTWDGAGPARMRFLLKPKDLSVETRLKAREPE